MEEKDVLGLEEEVKKGRYMTFQLDDKYYGIGISYVNEIIGLQPITKVPETEDFIIGLINLRGKIIPVIDVRIRFHMERRPYDDRTCIIVVEIGPTVIGLIVDTIAEVVTIPDKDVIPPPIVTPGFSQSGKFVYGIGKINDDVKMLLDLNKLIAHENPEGLSTNE